jgi:predicted glycosyltransferase
MDESKNSRPRAMVCPLNWGLGHASRCIPLIQKLQSSGFDVIIAADGHSLALLQEEFKNVKTITFPGFSPRFSSRNNQVSRIPSWLFSLAINTFKEHRTIKYLVKENKIDVVISDNRYGLFTKEAKSVFITHQIMFKTPAFLKFTEPLLYLINRFFILNFDFCWIPDLPGCDNLSGDLSHKYPLPGNASFIGLLSRFMNYKETCPEKSSNVLALLSGPEPQRSIFEKLIIDNLIQTNKPGIIIKGTPLMPGPIELNKIILHYNHLNTDDLAKRITESEFVICRSGYSTLMDLTVLGKKSVLFVPTPGQTEQEYLAKRLSKLGWINFVLQNNFTLDNSSGCEKKPCGINLPADDTLLDMQIKSLIDSLKTLRS